MHRRVVTASVVAGALLLAALAAVVFLPSHRGKYMPRPAESYCRWWIFGSVREVADIDGWVYWVQFCSGKRPRVFCKTLRSELEQERIPRLKFWLDYFAREDVAQFEGLDWRTAANLTGRTDLPPAEWQKWWKANGAHFALTPERIAAFKEYLVTKTEYNYADRWDFIARERERLGLPQRDWYLR